MPQDKKVTWEELQEDLDLIWPSEKRAEDVEDPNEPGFLRRAGGIGTRLVGGVASSLVGAVPSFVTTPGAAAIGGLAEELAQRIESDKPVNRTKVAAEAALSAIPFSKVYKYGAPVLSNVLRGAGLGIGSNMFRRGVDNEGNPLPTSGTDLAWDVAGGVLGGGAGYLTKTGPKVAGDDLEELLARVAGSPASNRGGLVRPTIEGIDRPHITPPSRITRRTAGVDLEGRPVEGGPLVPPDSDRLGGVSLETPAPLAPGVGAKQAEIIRKPFKVNKAKTPGEDVPLTDANKVANIDESIERATDLAEAQRKAHGVTKKQEDKLLTAERQADLQYAKATTGTDLGKKLSDVEKAHVKFIREEAEQEAKNLNAAGKYEEAKAVEEAAQTKIAEFMKGKEMETSQTLKASDKVKTDSGTKTLTTNIREKPPEKPDASKAGDGDGKAPSEPPPPGTKPGTGPVNRFISKAEAEKALVVVNKMGKTGHVEKMDPNGNFYHIVFDTPTTAAAVKAVDAPVIPPPPPEAPPAVAAPVTPKPTPPAPPAAAAPAPNPTITRKVSKPAGHDAYVKEARTWSDDELKQGFTKFGGEKSGLGRAIKQVQEERAAGKAVEAPTKTPVSAAPAPEPGPPVIAKVEPPKAPAPKPEAKAAPAKAKAPAKPKALPEGAVPFTDKNGRARHAVESPTVPGTYRVYDSNGRYIYSDSGARIKAAHKVELSTSKPSVAKPDVPAAKPTPVAKVEAPPTPKVEAPVAPKPEPPATPKTPPTGLKPLTELEKWNQLVNKYDKRESIELHAALKNQRASNGNPDDIRAIETILRRRGETVKPPVIARVEPPKQGTSIIPAKSGPAQSPTTNYKMVPQDKGKWGIRDNKTGQIIYSSKNKDDVADKLERIAKEETTPTVGKRDTPPAPSKPTEKLGGQGPENYPYRGTKMGIEEKSPPIRAPKGPDTPPPAAAPAPVKPKPKSPDTPKGATAVDLAGAKDAPEVQRRVINELEKYAKKVDKAEDSKMVSDKGVVSYGEPLPEPLVLHVPGGPTITVKPDQVKASIQNFEKQGPKPWQGIVDDTPKPTHITVPTGYGQSFGSKTGSAPSVKLPIGPTKSAAPIAKASAKPTPKVEAKTEVPAKAAVPIAPKPSVDDLRSQSKQADEAYGKLKDRKKAGEDVKAELDAAGEALGRARHALKLAEMTPEEQAAYLLSKENKAKAARPEPTSDDLAKMSPEEQSKELTRIVNAANKKKGKGLGEKGIALPELLAHMGAGALGASIAAANNPDDPITAALLGGAAGVGTTVGIRAAINHVNNNPNLPQSIRDKSKRMVFDKVKDQYETFGWMFPQYYRASLLSNPASLAINSVVGPYGAGFMAAMEHAIAGDPRGFKAMKGFLSIPFASKENFPKEFFKSFNPAREMIQEATERTEGMAAVHGPEWFKAATSAPAWALTAGDEAARRVLIRAGFSEAEARAITLTSEPFTGWGKGVGRLRGAKGENDKQSLAMHMLMPFWRTNVNQLEQSLLRFPAIGPILGKIWKGTPMATRAEFAKQLMSGSAAATAYMLGSMTPKENSKYALKAVNNFGGQYGTIAGLAFIAGQARRAGKTPTQQVIAVADGAIFQNWPLPTADTLRDVIRIAKQVDSAKPGHKLDKVRVPYGVVPPFLSSREEVSIPAAMAGKTTKKFPYFESRPTEQERSIFAPFIKGLKVKESAKKLSRGQKAIAERKARIARANKE